LAGKGNEVELFWKGFIKTKNPQP